MAATDSSRLALLFGIFLSSVGLMSLVYVNMPQLQVAERESLLVPKTLEDAKVLARLLSRYKDRYHYTMIAGISVVYVLLALFICFWFWCSALGACICYLLSYLVGKRLVLRYWPDRVAKWTHQVDQHRDNLLWYIIFLRITPFLPNWFINVAAPVIGVPLAPFFFGTFCGVAPPSCLFVQAGHTLYTLTSTGAAVSWLSVALLALCACASLLPVLFKRSFAHKLEGKQE